MNRVKFNLVQSLLQNPIPENCLPSGYTLWRRRTMPVRMKSRGNQHWDLE